MRRDEVLTVLAANRERLQAMSVDRLSVFGSVARDEARAGSDVDILVECTPGVRIGHQRLSTNPRAAAPACGERA